MNKVKNAIILCAGLGNRLSPITINTPKPLINVLGLPIIERIIIRLNQLNIENIILVVGYLKDQFYYLKSKYRNIKIIYNDNFFSTNNITSLYKAKDFLSSSLIIEGDLLLLNSNIIVDTFSNINYKAIYVNHTDDWYFKINDKGYINEFGKGSIDCYQMIGISAWDETNGCKLNKCITQCIYNDFQNIFWDQVPLEIYKNDFVIKVENCQVGDVIEIDTFKELSAIDKRYNFNI